MRAWVAALRALAQRRLTEHQLRERLQRKGYPEDEIREAVQRAREQGYLDDRLFAQLYVEQKRKAVGDARLVGELVRRGIDRDEASRAVGCASCDQRERLRAAFEKLERTRTSLNYASAARALERLGFPASLIYAELRERAANSAAYRAFAVDD